LLKFNAIFDGPQSRRQSTACSFPTKTRGLNWGYLFQDCAFWNEKFKFQLPDPPAGRHCPVSGAPFLLPIDLNLRPFCLDFRLQAHVSTC
jgi:hypothetical protein